MLDTRYCHSITSTIMMEMVISKHLQTNSQTSGYRGDLQLGRSSARNIEKTSLVNTSYQSLPHSEFYQNSCLLTSPSLKLKELEISLYLDNFYIATCDTLYNKSSCQVIFCAIKVPVR